VVEIDQQVMRCFKHETEIARYPVSTAENGAGCRQGTHCTPLGWHVVAERFGSTAARGTVFRGRVARGVAGDLNSAADDDLITSRILWLHGLQPGYNSGGAVDSYQRYIYIHGTAQEQWIGQPVSHGCVRMRNDDVIDLFADTEAGALVYISQVSMLDG